MELVGDLPPARRAQRGQRFRRQILRPAKLSRVRASAIAKIAFTGETTTGRLIMQYASENLILVTLGARRQVATDHLLRRS